MPATPELTHSLTNYRLNDVSVTLYSGADDSDKITGVIIDTLDGKLAMSLSRAVDLYRALDRTLCKPQVRGRPPREHVKLDESPQ